MTPDTVLNLSIRKFWSASRHVDRIRAEQDIRTLNLTLCATMTAQGGGDEFHTNLRNSLLEQMGTVMMEKQIQSSKSEIMALLNK